MILTFAVVVGIAMISNVNAEEENWSNKINNWVVTEKQEIIEYQKNSWAEGKAQLARNWSQITSLFQGKQAQLNKLL